MPIGSWYLAAHLMAHGHGAGVFHAQALRDCPERFSEILAQARPDLVGFSVLNANRWGALDLAREVKKAMPGLPVVFGGPGATFLWRRFLTRHPEVDAVARGEGEIPLLALAETLEHGGSLFNVPGLCWRDRERLVENPLPPPVADLDTLADPAEHFTFQHAAMSRGCPEACAFCGSPAFWGRRVRFHSPEYFVRQLARLSSKGVRHVFVSDDTFTLNRDRVLETCARLVSARLPLTWCAISRVDRADPEVFRQMRRAGCIQISFGVEHGDPLIRARLGKRFDDGTVERAFSLALKAALLPRAYFIYGCPGETREAHEKTLALMERIKPLAAVFYMLAVFPGTALYKECLEKGTLTEDAWEERREDVAFCETDPEMDCLEMAERGAELRRAFARALPERSLAAELEDGPDTGPLRADFLSRLAMTFDHGDYAANPDVHGAAEAAERLYARALACSPSPRAFLGLGARAHRQGRFSEAERLLREGLVHAPEDEALHIMLGAALLALGRSEEALSHVLRAPGNPDAARLAARAREALERVRE
jgi:radical SAM superfamily enzyme YgiQ (UPF0313 family)